MAIFSINKKNGLLLGNFFLNKANLLSSSHFSQHTKILIPNF